MPKRRRLVTTTELADVLGISRRTLARYVENGWLTPTETTLGGHYRWDIDDVRRQIRERRKTDGAE